MLASVLAGAVAAHPPGQHLGLPGGHRRLVALELFDHGAHAVVAPDLGARGDVLPAQQEADEDDGRHRLDLTAQPPDREAMDTGEQTAVAPLRKLEAER